MSNSDRFSISLIFILLLYSMLETRQGLEKRHMELYAAIVENCTE